MSGTTRSMPNISVDGNITPQSTTMISLPYSNTVIFLPISPIPPRKLIFKLLTFAFLLVSVFSVFTTSAFGFVVFIWFFWVVLFCFGLFVFGFELFKSALFLMLASNSSLVIKLSIIISPLYCICELKFYKIALILQQKNAKKKFLILYYKKVKTHWLHKTFIICLKPLCKWFLNFIITQKEKMSSKY